jgi:hypothetical protein
VNGDDYLSLKNDTHGLAVVIAQFL